VCGTTGRRDEQERELRGAIDDLTKLKAASPAVAEYRKRLAEVQSGLASVLIVARRLPEAEAALRAEFEVRQSLANEFPSEVEYRIGMADHYGMLGMSLIWWGGRDAEIVKATGSRKTTR
jgi:hypothetical protein